MESDVQTACLEYLRIRRIFHWRQNSGAFRTQSGRWFKCCSIKGVSDILGVLPDGRFLAVECKSESGGRLSPEQKEFLSNINANGGLGVVVHSVDELANALELAKENQVRRTRRQGVSYVCDREGCERMVPFRQQE